MLATRLCSLLLLAASARANLAGIDMGHDSIKCAPPFARAALRTPWLFRRAHALLTTGTVSPEPTLFEKLSVVLRHLDLTAQYDGETRAAIRLRQHVAWYGKSMGHVKPLKEAIRLAPDFATTRRALEAARRVFTGSNAVYSDSGHAIAEGLFQAGFNEFSKVTCLDSGSE